MVSFTRICPFNSFTLWTIHFCHVKNILLSNNHIREQVQINTGEPWTTRVWHMQTLTWNFFFNKKYCKYYTIRVGGILRCGEATISYTWIFDYRRSLPLAPSVVQGWTIIFKTKLSVLDFQSQHHLPSNFWPVFIIHEQQFWILSLLLCPAIFPLEKFLTCSRTAGNNETKKKEN